MPEIDPYAEIFWRAEAEEFREIKSVNRAASAMAKRLGVVFVPDAKKMATFSSYLASQNARPAG